MNDKRQVYGAEVRCDVPFPVRRKTKRVSMSMLSVMYADVFTSVYYYTFI